MKPAQGAFKGGLARLAWVLCYDPAPVDLPTHYSYQEGRLFCQRVPLERIAREVGTPCYVYSQDAIRESYQAFRQALAPIDPLVCYAVKANSNLAVLNLLRELGSGFDIVSIGELKRVRRIGADPSRIVFSGVGKTREELEAALRSGILSLQVESLAELEALAHISREAGKTAGISFRFNPDVEARTHPYIATGQQRHKFGIDPADTGRISRILSRNPQLRAIGVGCHIGSQILDPRPFRDAFARVKAYGDDLRSRGLPIEHLDLGGGFGIPYRPGEKPHDLRSYAEFLKRERSDYKLLFEPGRLIVGQAGILLTRVLYRKQAAGKDFIIVDGAMNDLMRPSLYQAHHEVAPVREAAPIKEADLVGPICESGDFFARDRMLPDFASGDLAAVLNSGAYGFVLASNYNSRPRPAEVMVSGREFRIVREREGLNDLFRGESI